MMHWQMLDQPNMQHALAAGTAVAVLAGVLGFFVVLHGLSFAAHALAQIGFAGASGALLIGLDPLAGLLVFAVAGGIGIGLLNGREHGSDVTTALILVAALGCGALFLALNDTFATPAFSLLFGSIVGVSQAMVWQTAVLAALCLAALAVLYRPLLLTGVHAELAQARGVPARLVHVLFLVVLGVAAAITVPAVGTLLLFSLVVGPAATAARLVRRPGRAMLTAVALAVLATWTAIIAAYDTGWPVGFFVAAIVSTSYAAARLASPGRGDPRRSAAHAGERGA